MGKRRIIAETGAGQHGVATATVVRAAGDGVRRLHGRRGHASASAPTCSAWSCSARRVQPVDAGARTLKEATSAAIRDWVDQRREHPLRDRLGRRPRALPGDRAGAAAGDRRRGARAAARARGPAARARRRLRRRRLQRDRHLRRLHRRRAGRAGRRGGRRRGHRHAPPRGPADRRRAARASCTARARR